MTQQNSGVRTQCSPAVLSPVCALLFPCLHSISHLRLKQQGVWLTSTQHKGKDIVISGNTVTKTKSSWGTGTAIVSDGVTLKHGSSVKKRWSFTIKKGTQQTIGLVTSAYNAASDEYANKTTKGWGFYQSNGNKGHGGPAKKAYGAKYQTGDIVDGALFFSCL